MAGTTYTQTTGSRKGMTYTVIQKDGKDWRKYSNGDVVPIGPIGGTKPAAAAPASPAAPAGAPAANSTTTPTIAPFANPSDNMGLAQETQSTGLQSAQINQGVGDLAATTAYQVAQNDKTALRNTTDEKDVAAAHGLFNSSIKDGALADIEAQRTIQNNFLNDALGRATANAATNTGILASGMSDYQAAYNQQKVQNAQTIADGIEPAAPKPVTPAAAAPKPAAATSSAAAGGIGGWQANAPSTASKPASGYTFVQTTGTRAGMSYNVIQHGSQNIRVYSNGERIPI